MLSSFKIQVSEHMAGMKKAVKQGDTFFVSPSMHALMKDATQEELQHLLSNLHYIEIPKFDPFDLPLTFGPSL